MAKLTLPKIDITFKQLANTFVERSTRGIPILIIRDNTNRSFTVKEYGDMDALAEDQALYNLTNYTYMLDVLTFKPTKLVVVRIDDADESESIEKADIQIALKAIKQKYKTGWIGGVLYDEDYQAIATWVDSVRKKEHLTFKTFTVNVDGSDSRGVYEFHNPSVTFNDGRGKQDAKYYIPSLIGIASVCNIKRGITYYICKNLSEVEEVADVDTSLNKGKFILINDYDVVRVGLGINSLVTFDGEETFEDMRYMDINEALDMIADDIKDVYKSEYVGKVKNKYDNQILFISAINNYFDELESDDVEVLDNLYNNVAFVDVVAQKKAWVAVKPEAKDWDETKVKNMSFKRTVFLAGDVKVLGSMENLQFGIMFN